MEDTPLATVTPAPRVHAHIPTHRHIVTLIQVIIQLLAIIFVDDNH